MRIAVLLVLAITACRGDAQRCEQACRNYATLVYWDKANADIAAKPPAERKLARQRKLSEFTNSLESEIDTCTSQCQSANNDTQVGCMIDAKTAKDARACVDD